MTKVEILEALKRIAHEEYDVAVEDVTRESRIVYDLGVDSLGLVEGILAVEEIFDIDVPNEDAEKWRTVGDVADYVEAILSDDPPIPHQPRPHRGSPRPGPAVPMSGPRDFVPIWVWPAFWASDAYWLARRKLVHVAWIAGILAHGRRKDDDG